MYGMLGQSEDTNEVIRSRKWSKEIQYAVLFRHKTLNEALPNTHIQYSPNSRHKTLNETLPNKHIQ
jgi:hypothetical protein